MSIRKSALLLVPVLLVLAFGTFAIGGNVVDYTYDADGNITNAATSSATAVYISANPASILPGGTTEVTLSWASMNADTGFIEGIGQVIPPEHGSITVRPTQTTTYTITATRGASTATDSVTVTVTANPPPTVSISASHTSIYQGESSMLTWTFTNAPSCTIAPNVGTFSENGSISVYPMQTTTYTITAEGPGGKATATAIVTVAFNPAAPPPTVQISAHPQSIEYGASSTLEWRSTNAEWCDIWPDVGVVGPNWSIEVSPAVTTKYTITAYGAGDATATAEVTVTVTYASPQSVILRPNAAGDETNIPGASPGGNHWDMVDDVTPDNDGTLVYTLYVNTYKRDLYALSNHTGSGTINWIKVWIRSRGDPTAARAKTAIKTGGTVYEGSEIALTTSYTNYYTQYTTNPYTGLPWTWSDLDALQAGTSIHDGGVTYSRCTQVYVEVNYTPGPVLPTPTVSIAADPTTIKKGASSTLRWRSTNAEWCQITPWPEPDVGIFGPNWSIDVSPSATTTYTITAYGEGSTTATAQVTVVVGVPIILHKDGAIWSLDSGWTTTTPPYYQNTSYAVDIEYRADGSYVILHKDGAIYDSASGWVTTAPPYYPGLAWAVDMKLDGSGNYILLHRDGSLWSSSAGWTLTAPPYYQGTDYARALQVRTDNSYVILHKDGAIYDSSSGWVTTTPPYYPGLAWAVDMKLDGSGNYILLHRDGALWSSYAGWTMTTPPYYPGTAYARTLELAGSRYFILHQDGAIYDSASGWLMTAPPYYPGTGWAVDLEIK